MKKLLLVGVAVLVLASGGIAGWQLFGGGGNAQHGDDAAQSGAGRIADELAYIELEPFIIAVFGEDRVVKHISVTLKLEVAGPAAREKAQKAMPLLRDALFTRLHASLSRARPGDAPVDLRKLKRSLLAACETAVGKDVVRAVLIKEMAEKTEP